jgi:hypothetical protein
MILGLFQLVQNGFLRVFEPDSSRSNIASMDGFAPMTLAEVVRLPVAVQPTFCLIIFYTDIYQRTFRFLGEDHSCLIFDGRWLILQERRFMMIARVNI